MSSLYHISKELNEIFDAIQQSEGEVSPELETALSITHEQLEQKGVQYGYKCMSIDAENYAIEKEIERLKGLKKANDKLSERLKTVLSNTMHHFGIEELKTPTLKISFRRSESVEIEDLDAIPTEFTEQKVTVTASKAKIKEAIKKGEVISGAKLIVKDNIQIK